MDQNEMEDSITIDLPMINSTMKVYPPSISLRVYFSVYHLWAAEYFADVSATLEGAQGRIPRFDIQHRAYITNSILSSVAFLEAAVNEFFKDIKDENEASVSSIERDSRNLISAFWDSTEERNRSPFSILDKYQMLLIFCKKEAFNLGGQPYQDANLAVKLRNELIHFMPNTYSGDVQHRFQRQLSGKFPNNPLMEGSTGNPFFPDHCLGSGCAKWVAKSVKTLADEFFQRLGLEPHYQKVEF